MGTSEIGGYDLRHIYNIKNTNISLHDEISIGNKRYNIKKLSIGEREKLYAFLKVKSAGDDFFTRSEQKQAEPDRDIIKFIYTVAEKAKIAKNPETNPKDLFILFEKSANYTYKEEYDPERTIEIALASNEKAPDKLFRMLADFLTVEPHITMYIRQNIAMAIIHNKKAPYQALDIIHSYFSKHADAMKDIVAAVENHENYRSKNYKRS